MTLTLTLTKGLSGSGKSTWALQQVRDYPDRFKRVNRDSLRQMIDGGLHNVHREKNIKQAELLLADMYIDLGYHIIVDDTNLSPSSQHMWETFAKQKKVVLIWKDFTDTPLDVCIQRDLQRLYSVGESVIRKQYKQYLAPATKQQKHDHSLPLAFICDLDGTLALLNGRGPYESEKCDLDLLNEPLAFLVRQAIECGLFCIFTSGRANNYTVATKTMTWLEKHGFTRHCALYMRQDGDRRRDWEVKEEIYARFLEGKYCIEFVFDDRKQVVEAWRRLGLTCFQVAEGDY